MIDARDWEVELMRLADSYWEASTAARYHYRAKLLEHVQTAAPSLASEDLKLFEQAMDANAAAHGLLSEIAGSFRYGQTTANAASTVCEKLHAAGVALRQRIQEGQAK